MRRSSARPSDSGHAPRWEQLQLGAIPFGMALIDESGRIVEVNEIYRRFARETGASSALIHGIGVDYLAVCRSAQDPGLRLLGDGIEALLRGRKEPVEVVYPCHSLNGLRWLSARASRTDDLSQVLLVQSDATEYALASARLKVQMSAAQTLGARLSMDEAAREVGLALCEALSGDFVGVWVLEPQSWTLRCVSSWVRDGRLVDFEEASRGAALGPGAGLPGRAWGEVRVQWATDRDLVSTPGRSKTSFTVMPPKVLSAGFRTAVAFPLKCGGDVLAVVEVLSTVACERDESLIELLEVAGEQLALWELRERAERYAQVAMEQADDAHAQLDAVLTYAPGYVVLIDRNDRVQFVNRSAPTIRKEDVIGKPWRTQLPKAMHEKVGAALRAVFETGTPQTYELSLPGPDGRPTWLASHVGPMRTAQGIMGAVIIAQDITDVRRGQAELADAQRLATVGTLAAGVAHEINTPVQFVSDSIHFVREAANDTFRVLDSLLALQRAALAQAPANELRALADASEGVVAEADLTFLQENVPKALERSVDGLERVTAIVHSMKEFSHPASKEKHPVDLNRAIAATLTVARNEYKYVATLETDFGELPPVPCHVNEINQAVLNIVVNAAHAIGDRVKGTDAQGTISVRTRQEGAAVVISIRDTGLGIPEEIQARIFDPFFTTKEVGRGTGQGLSIARRAIQDRHCGDLTFETVPGVGTTFHLRLPLPD